MSGKDKTYQCSGAQCSETCNIDLYRRKIGNNNPLINRQYDSSVLLSKNGVNLQSKSAASSQGNMEPSVSQSNSSYSRVLTEQSEYSGRLAIQKSQRFKRIEIESQNIFSDCENQRNTSNRPICFPTEPSVTKIHVLASRPRHLCSRFPSALLEKPSRVCIPSILLNTKVLAKVRKDQSLLLILTPAWQTQPWYAALLAMSVRHPIIPPDLTTLAQDPQGQKHPSVAGCKKRTSYRWSHGRFQESIGS